jgi:peptidoglycan/LPS O-acetylase OafA/YrhL
MPSPGIKSTDSKSKVLLSPTRSPAEEIAHPARGARCRAIFQVQLFAARVGAYTQRRPQMVAARVCRKFGEGNISVSEGPVSDWRVNNFDLLRLLAALQVAVGHSIAILKPTGYFARLLVAGLDRFPGVPIFFVISGVLISKSYEHSDSLRDYLRNRCLRIFPGLWVCLVASVAVILAFGVGSLGRITTPDWLLWWAGQMSFFQNTQATFLDPMSHGLNPSLWTIPIELEFYIVLPALYGILRLRSRLGNMRLLSIALASLAVHPLIVHSHGQVRAYSLLEMTLAPYLWMFLVGVAIQRNWSTVRGWLFGRAHWWGLGYLMVCAAANWLRVDTGGNNLSPVYLLPLAGLIVSLAVSAPRLSDKILRHHDYSYGLYLYHMLVIDLLVALAAPSRWASVAIAIIVSLGLAALSWSLIEKPYLRSKRAALRVVYEGKP